MIKEHDCVALTKNPPEEDLEAGDVGTERFQAALELQKRFRDRPDISFTDLTSMAIMRELQITAVVTDFERVGTRFELRPR